MNKLRLSLVVLSLALMGTLISGCMQVSQEIKVNHDGTGMVVETIKFSPMVMQIIKGFAEGMMDSEEEMSESEELFSENLFPEKQFQEKAQQMGEGVEFISREVKEFQDGMVGYVAQYKISDINKFTLNPLEEKQMIKKPGTNTPTTFYFERGISSSYLTIKQHFLKDEGEKKEEIKKEVEKKEKSSKADEEELANLREMFKGMRLQIVVECGEEIKTTNADFWDKNRITLLDFDVGQLLSYSDKLKMLSGMEKPQTKEDYKKFLQGIEGIKFDLNEEIQVKFR